MDPWLNYHHLYYFFVIVQKGSIAEASAVLRVGSPTLSTQLKQLEERFDSALFERRGKQLILTEHGRLVYEYAKEIFKLGSELSEVMRTQKTRGRRHLHLGALDCVPKSLIADLVEACQKEFSCSVTVSEGQMEQLIHAVHSHRMDLIITNFSNFVSEGAPMFTRLIAKAPIAVFGTSKYQNLKKGFPRSLEGTPTILPSSTSRLRSELDQYFQLHQIHPDVVAETQDTSVQKLLGRRAIGIVPLPTGSFKSSELYSGLIELGTLEGVYEEFFLISGKRKIENPIASYLFKQYRSKV